MVVLNELPSTTFKLHILSRDYTFERQNVSFHRIVLLDQEIMRRFELRCDIQLKLEDKLFMARNILFSDEATLSSNEAVSIQTAVGSVMQILIFQSKPGISMYSK